MRSTAVWQPVKASSFLFVYHDMSDCVCGFLDSSYEETVWHERTSEVMNPHTKLHDQMRTNQREKMLIIVFYLIWRDLKAAEVLLKREWPASRSQTDYWIFNVPIFTDSPPLTPNSVVFLSDIQSVQALHMYVLVTYCHLLVTAQHITSVLWRQHSFDAELWAAALWTAVFSAKVAPNKSDKKQKTDHVHTEWTEDDVSDMLNSKCLCLIC